MQQRALIGSALLAEAGSTAPPLVFDRRGEAHFEACIGLPRAPYLIAVASDREPPPLPPSLYIDRGDVGSEQIRIVELAERLQETEFRRSRVQADLSEVQAELSQVRVELARMQAELSKATENHRRVRAEFTEVTDDLRETSQRADRSEQARRASEDRNEALRRERDLVQRQFGLMQGSLRTFMRGYLPRLRRRLRRQRP